MPNATDYVAQYGNTPFSQRPFCDADNVSLCGVFYMPVEKVVKGGFEGTPVTIKQASEMLFRYNGSRHISHGLFLSKLVSREFEDLANHSRYSDLLLTGCVSEYNAETNTQFGAVTVILPDGTLVVIFRGTDDTVAGWLEDVDMLMKGTIPSHKLAVDYIEKAASAYDGDIIVCGHSKGGHLALYTALNCSDSTRDRIVRIYNNDGPGFSDYELFKTPQYRQILPRYKHFIPQGSFIGLLLAHDRDYTVIKSNRILGPFQHDPNTWQVVGGELVYMPELSIVGKVNELSLIRLLADTTEKQRECFYRLLVSSAEASGQTCLLDLVKHIVPSAAKIVKNVISLDKDTKDTFMKSVLYFGKLMVQSYKDIKDGEQAPKQEPATAVV